MGLISVERERYITRRMVRLNPHKVFLFGDNLVGRGFGGQAKEMRGEPNAVGVPTKNKPTMESDAFFNDRDIWSNSLRIDRAIKAAKALAAKLASKFHKPPTLVISADGLGSGRAQLKERAPQTFEYLQMKLKELSD